MVEDVVETEAITFDESGRIEKNSMSSAGAAQVVRVLVAAADPLCGCQDCRFLRYMADCRDAFYERKS